MECLLPNVSYHIIRNCNLSRTDTDRLHRISPSQGENPGTETKLFVHHLGTSVPHIRSVQYYFHPSELASCKLHDSGKACGDALSMTAAKIDTVRREQTIVVQEPKRTAFLSQAAPIQRWDRHVLCMFMIWSSSHCSLLTSNCRCSSRNLLFAAVRLGIGQDQPQGETAAFIECTNWKPLTLCLCRDL